MSALSHDKSPLVSVIIPCYNSAQFVGEAIESALRQTHVNLEIIVVDDGSSDNGFDVAIEYSKSLDSTSKVRVLQQENGGVSSARNVGFRASRGDFLLFLDADDRLLPHALETLLDALKPSSNECAFAFGRPQFIDTNGEKLEVPAYAIPRRVVANSDFYREMMREGFLWPSGSILFRRHVLEEIGGFNERFHTREDVELYLRILRKFPKILPLDEIVIDYRRHETNNSNMFRDPHEVFLRIYWQQLPHISRNPALRRIWLRRFVLLLRKIARANASQAKRKTLKLLRRDKQ